LVLTLTLTKPQLLGMLAANGLEGIQTNGDPGALHQLLGLLDTPAGLLRANVRATRPRGQSKPPA
jgi:hypothetical protein